MKYVLACLAVMFVLGACQKEINGEFINNPSDTTHPTNTSGLITAKVDGVDWKADQSATATVVGDSNNNFLVTIAGTKTDGTSVQLLMQDFKTGTFDFTDTSLNDGVYHDASGDFDASNDTTLGVIHGTIQVTSIDTLLKTISGTFSFTGYNDSATASRAITNGVFTNVPYTISGIPPASSTDTLFVNVDSSFFNAYAIGSATAGIDLAIAGTNLSGDTALNINMPYNVTVGTYTFNDSTYKAVYVETGRDTLKASGGTLQIIENNTSIKRLRGSFSFTARNNGSPADSAVFTAGYFSVGYP